MKPVILFSSLVMSLALASCSTKELRINEFQVPSGAPDPAQPPDEFYVIGPGDVLNINVWREPSISGGVKVRPDGYITIPLINEIQVAGLTTAQVRKVLEEKYRQFLADAYVTIRVEGIASSEVYFIERSGRSAVYTLAGNETILQLITRAGGLGIFDDRSNIHIVRRQGDKITEYIVDYDAILKGDLKQDILLRPGDRILIP